MGRKTQVSVVKDAASPASLRPDAPPLSLVCYLTAERHLRDLEGVYKEKMGVVKSAGEGSRWDQETPGVLRYGGKE